MYSMPDNSGEHSSFLKAMETALISISGAWLAASLRSLDMIARWRRARLLLFFEGKLKDSDFAPHAYVHAV
jgi:hypothetical protein